jgi:hypothetical protein
MYILSWYLLVQNSKAKYNYMWPTQKKKKIIFIFFEQKKSSQCSVIWAICHFCVGHLQPYFFLKTYMSKYQSNMYMYFFFKLSNMNFRFVLNGCAYTWVLVAILDWVKYGLLKIE